MKIKRFISVVLSGVLLSNSLAYAGLGDHFDSMFEAMAPNSNVTEGGAYMSARRGVVTLGSIETRAKVLTPNIVSFDPPSFNAGCNGISLHGGALSFINGEEFQNNLRAIAANASGLLSGYVFKMALSAMCEDCEKKIAELADKINTIGRALKNSCHSAEALVGLIPEVPKAWTDSVRSSISIEGSTKGIVGDVLEGMNSSLGKVTDALDASQKRVYFGNVLYKAFEDNAFDSMFPASVFVGFEVRQMMMSMAGTVIINKSPDSDKDININYLPPLIFPQNFVGGGVFDLYSCSGDEECNSPTVVEDVEVPGFYFLVRELLFGDSPESGVQRTVGIIAKFRSIVPNQVFDSREIAFINAVKPNMIALFAEHANRQNIVSVFQEEAAYAIAQSVTAKYLQVMIGAMEASLSTYKGKEGVEPIRKKIDSLRTEVSAMERDANIARNRINDAIAIDSKFKDDIRRKTFADK